jgi:2-polyprenyl-3-methyl-5-hydroxy-6-metoxy-1,4-benzoquinol methylase
MAMKQWYESLFQDFANSYDNEEFTKGTRGEVDFIEKEIGHDRSVKILDIGCGTGRHDIELARRGYDVTGVDLSRDQLERARQKARKAGVKVRFRCADARHLKYRQRFGLVIMLCEGAFPLMETDEMNFQILKGAYAALRPGGRIIFTTLSGLFPLFHSVKDFMNKNSSHSRSKKNTFDLMTFRDHSTYEARSDSGRKVHLKCNERYYVPSEITWQMRGLGFCETGIFGAHLGHFSRKHKLTTEDFEMLVCAKK